MQNNTNTITVFVRDEDEQPITQFKLGHYPTYQKGDELLLIFPRPDGKERTVFARITKPIVHIALKESDSEITQTSLNVSVAIGQDSNDAEEETESLTTNQPDHV